ncbi:hypothetical protein [Neobacillus sp. OS1-33]|uniref:hypothetical protein n=1 Tax=Neobacillus sp. OS1-33 TaxID=3070683 RepID=UPI0027E0784C|nr:hypothetical protein [Neobacillus sp. OS1-33]WML26267.1 hypothetical protein RCG22_01065 [Neobacillus sp. OS1-33]
MKKTEEVIAEFEAATNEKCATYDLGIIHIDPERIIALSLEEEDIKDDRKMRILKEKVEEYGWTNEGPFGFALLQFPNGDLAVTGGGNHRAYLSKELKKQGKLEFVKANVFKVVYTDRLPKDTLKRLNQLESIIDSETVEDEELLNDLIKERYDILSNISQ